MADLVRKLPESITWSMFATALTLASGILYLLGYWGSFSINPFQFLSFDDLLRSSIYPLFGFISLYVFHFIFYGAAATSEQPGANLEDEKGATRVASRSQKLKLALLAGVVVAIWLLDTWLTGAWWQLYYLTALCLAYGLGRHVSKSRLVIHQLPQEPFRTIASVAVFAFPLLAFAEGHASYTKLQLGRGDFRYLCPRDAQGSTLPDKVSELRFVGKADDYFFFIQEPNRSDLQILQYQHLPERIFRQSRDTKGDLLLNFVAPKTGEEIQSLCPPRR
jgi:hypothetical protein